MFAANRRAALDLTSCYLDRNRRSRLFQGKLLYMAGPRLLPTSGSGNPTHTIEANAFRVADELLKRL